MSSSIFSSESELGPEGLRTTEGRLATSIAITVAVLSLIMAPLLRHWLPTLIHLRLPDDPVRWSWNAQALLLAVGLSLPVVVWTLVVRWELARNWRLPRWMAWVGALCLVTATSASLSHPKLEWFILEAVKLRSEKFSYSRAVAFWKAENLEIGTATGQHEERQVVLIGSSQMNFAVDMDRVAEALPGNRVRKKALPGFNAMNYLLAEPELELKTGDVVVCWLSEFDFFREDDVPANRLRSFARAATWPTLVGCLDSEVVPNAEPMMDLAVGAATPAWRLRDLHRVLMLDFWWRSDASPGEPSFEGPEKANIEKQGENLARSVRRGDLVAANFASFEAFAKRLQTAGVRLLVVEGQSHPISRQLYDPEFRRETRLRLVEMAERCNFEFDDESVLPRFNADDFADAYHLDAEATQQFTDFLITRLTNLAN